MTWTTSNKNETWEFQWAFRIGSDENYVFVDYKGHDAKVEGLKDMQRIIDDGYSPKDYRGIQSMFMIRHTWYHPRTKNKKAEFGILVYKGHMPIPDAGLMMSTLFE